MSEHEEPKVINLMDAEASFDCPMSGTPCEWQGICGSARSCSRGDHDA